MQNLTLRKNWILGGYSACYEASAPLTQEALSDIIDGYIRTVLPSAITGQSAVEVTDFKGRDPRDELLPGLPSAQSDEIFRVGGVCAVEECDSSFEWEPFDISYNSVFQRFEGDHHIVHSLETQRSGSLPPWLPIRFLGSAAPIRPTYFRFGLEHFRSRLSFASIGYNPEVTESLLLDISRGELRLRVNIESRKRYPEDPFESLPALLVAAQVLKQVCALDIRGGFNALLKEKW
jgi:hypothetical protein